MKNFQKLIYQIKEIIDVEFGVIDESGRIIGCSDVSRTGSIHPAMPKVKGNEDIFIIFDGATFQKVYINNKLELIVYINSNDNTSKKFLSLIAINILNIRHFFDEKLEKNNFLRNIILDNILQGDIVFKAKEMELNINAYRAVFLIKTENMPRGVNSYKTIKSIFPDKGKDFIIILDDESTVLIKEFRQKDNIKETNRIAKIIIDALNKELLIKSQIGIGSIVNNIRDIGRSYKEAKIALQIGCIFEDDKSIINYNNLGIGRLIYQLPVTLCKLFLKEIFREGSFDLLDEETLLTIRKFFENNLNISETARQLYIHRNTLVYRLDKIQKLTGLDLRSFDDAITFNVSLLVNKYLKNIEKLGR